jgi:Right handed beta helix region
MISRRKILKGGAAAVVIASVPFLRARVVFAQSALPFDYFISANGDDNNAGSLASPWSITALNSKQSKYSGKRIGIIGDIAGTQTPIQHGTIGGVQTTLYSMYQAGGSAPVLVINGGNSSASTYIGSCNSAGAYTPRSAIIDFSNPSSGAKPTVENMAMGQSFYQTSVPNPGYATVDALTIRNFTFAALGFSNLSGFGTMPGITIQNCEIYNGGHVASNNNPGAILLAGASNPVITNNKIHDLQTIPGGADPMWGLSALRTYSSTGIVFTHNTCYNCSSVLTKDSHQWFANCSYNYLDHGIFGSAGSGGDLSAGSIVGHSPGSGQTSVIHHNIMLGPLGMHPQDGLAVAGAVQFYNNTLYGSPSYNAAFDAVTADNAASGAALQFYHNIVYAVNGYDTAPASILVQSTCAVANATFNNNVYGSNGNGVSFSRAYAGGSLAAWRSATGCDQNSVIVSASPFTGTPTTQAPSSFATGSSAVIGGVTCGALDGSGTVGCNFASGEPVPASPALRVS